MKFVKFSNGNMKINSVLAFILLVMLLHLFLGTPESTGIELYSNNKSNLKSPECIPIDTSTITMQNITYQEVLSDGKLIPNNLDVTAIDINSKDHVLYILGIHHGKAVDKDTYKNLVLMIDTKLKNTNEIMINDDDLELDKIFSDERKNELYLTGVKIIKNNDKLVKNNVIYLISLPSEKQEILFNDMHTGNSSTPAQDNDEIGIVDIDVDTESNNVYVVLNKNIDIQNDISASRYQLVDSSHMIRDNISQIYIIPFGNAIINSPEQKVNYILFNGIKSYDKDVVLALNETAGSINKNYSLPSLNSRDVAFDSKKGKLYVLGDSFAYNDNINGFSKQCEIITSIDTVGNKMTTLSLGDFIVKDYINNPKNDAFYIIGKNHVLNSQQKSNDDHLLELDASTGTTKSIMSIPLNLNYIIMNNASNTLFVIGKDLNRDQNVMFSIDLNRK